MKRLILAISILLISLTTSEATTILGYGTNSCGTYIFSYEDVPVKFHYLIWAQGFLTGSNVSDTGNRHIGPDAIALWLLNYCKENPLKSFAVATTLLGVELKNKHNQ